MEPIEKWDIRVAEIQKQADRRRAAAREDGYEAAPNEIDDLLAAYEEQGKCLRHYVELSAQGMAAARIERTEGLRRRLELLHGRVKAIAECGCILTQREKDPDPCSANDRCSYCRCAQLLAQLEPQVCGMIIYPNHEGSPDVECGKPAVATYHGWFVCADCLAGFDADMKSETRPLLDEAKS